MEFKDPLTPLEQIPAKYRGAFSRWRKIKQISLADRFWPHVQIRSHDKCWPFTGKDTIRDGYGVVTLSAKPRVRWLAHRLAWFVTNGPIPDGLLICHHCDNPPCCNPRHLFVGTSKDNTRDCINKGRAKHPKGEWCHSTVLTEAKVLKIRAIYKLGGISRTDVGKLFGVSKGAIQKIVTRRSWTHI